MLSSEKLSAFLRLQQVVLDTEVTSNPLSNLISSMLIMLSQAGFIYEFVGTIFFDENGDPLHAYCNPSACANFLKVDILAQKESGVRSLLLGSKLYITSNIELLLDPKYLPRTKARSLIISSIICMGKMRGMVIFASMRQDKEITQEEQEFLIMLTSLIGLAHQLQDSQQSISNITQEVYKANVQLHQVDKLKDDFVSVASHELRTPMTAIKSYAWMALNRPDMPLSDKVRRYLSRVLISTDRLIKLVNDMLNVSRIESGSVEVLPRAFNMVELTKEVFAEIQPKAVEKNLQLQLENIQVPPVFGDPDKVHQILLNLLGNALKFTPQGRSIWVGFFTDGLMVETSIKDSGVGILKEDLPRLFKKFGRLDNSYVSAATTGGTGLGLYICKSLIELMKGRIWASSAGTGKGATFTFSLPVATNQVITEAEQFTHRATGGAKPLEPVAI